MSKVLIITGPTATGKTAFALSLAQLLNGELISADSRQVYVGKNIITGKDLPENLSPITSTLTWHNRKLKYYSVQDVKIWGYDIVEPGELFNVSFWKECAEILIADILSRSKLPIVVGGTGLFIKSLTADLSYIAVPANSNLRLILEKKDPQYLFDYLKRLNPQKADKLNDSDRANPRRLIRAIEISESIKDNTQIKNINNTHDFLIIGITAPKDTLFKRVSERVRSRITAGAFAEDPSLVANPQAWEKFEHDIVRRQLTWFKKQPNINWYDFTVPNWQLLAKELILKWLKHAS